MVFLLLEITFVIILLICLWCIVNYMMLILTKRSTDKLFHIVLSELKKLYEYILQILSENTLFEQEQNQIVEETKNLINTASVFSVSKDGNERIVGYANSILKNIQNLLDGIKEKEAFLTDANIQNFVEKQKEFNKIKQHYNESAKNLKHFADVFPTSLMARLKCIRTMDFLD